MGSGSAIGAAQGIHKPLDLEYILLAMSAVDLAELRRLLAALIAAAEAGELAASATEMAALHGALVVVESLVSVQDTTV